MSITKLLRTTSPARSRSAIRAGVIGAAIAVPLLTASAALADAHPYEGENSGPGLTVLQTLGLYVGIPLGLFLLIALLVALPGWVRGDRNRREVGWSGRDGAGAGPGNGTGPSSGSAASASSSAAEGVGAGKSGGTGGASGSW